MTQEKAIAAARRADADGLADALIAMPEKQRRSLHEALSKIARSIMGN